MKLSQFLTALAVLSLTVAVAGCSAFGFHLPVPSAPAATGSWSAPQLAQAGLHSLPWVGTFVLIAGAVMYGTLSKTMGGALMGCGALIIFMPTVIALTGWWISLIIVLAVAAVAVMALLWLGGMIFQKRKLVQNAFAVAGQFTQKNLHSEATAALSAVGAIKRPADNGAVHA